MKFGIIVSAAALAVAPIAAHAAAPAPKLTVGATVTGNDSNPIGTIASNQNGTVVVDTGAHKIPIPATAFGKGKTGPTLNITKTQLDQMYAAQLAKQQAKLQAAMVMGAQVITADSKPLGAITKMDGDNLIVTEDDGQKVTLPKNIMALNASGALMVRANMSDIQAALAAQSNSQSATQQGG